jgi:hypothetical protein
MEMIVLFFCLTLVAIVALTSRNNGGNSATANKAIDALQSIARKK